MNFKTWLAEHTLYHGTTIDNMDSIRDIGLVGSTGSLRRSSYDELPEDEIPEIVFAADKQKLSNALSAMVHQIGHKLNKDFHDVTDNEIVANGLLVIIHDGDQYATHRPPDDDNYYGQHPYTVEPGDYYADRLPAHRFVTGRGILRIMKRYGAWPRTYGPQSDKRLDTMRGQLTAAAIQRHSDHPKQTVIDKAKSLTPGRLQQQYRNYGLERR